MQSAINSLAVLSFLGTALLFFAFSALLKTVRELQGALVRTESGAPAPNITRSNARFRSDDGQPTFVLVVSEHCDKCRDRTRHLDVVAGAGVAGHLVVLCASGCSDWVADSTVTPIVDAELLGALGVGAMPSLVRYAPDGTEEWRRVVGSDEDLDTLLEIGSKTSNPVAMEVDA
ncbi:MAG TPA: hypothetical protein VFG33_02955 [Kribbella sp.]|uniref:hypothetical protein n=1 Tax=Kribbella sp. TaxID=1871183 RepID=UPI002D779951|nr:hypothetical protein [Kribbella sp.]HET6292298.1 hypothetical protein [Kribbella sp.]